MVVGNEIVKWIIIVLLAYLYGVIVQHVLKYERDNRFVTFSIGVVGIIIGKHLLPFLYLSKYLYIVGIPLISSLVGSFIIPGIMWFLRRDNFGFGFKRK